MHQILGQRRGILRVDNFHLNDESMQKLAAAFERNNTMTGLEIRMASKLSLDTWQRFVAAFQVNKTMTSAFKEINTRRMTSENIAAVELAQQFCQVRYYHVLMHLFVFKTFYFTSII